jgi:HD-GYP domain-containing protein (c-di-GMP phosphodiesterase class II)
MLATVVVGAAAAASVLAWRTRAHTPTCLALGLATIAAAMAGRVAAESMGPGPGQAPEITLLPLAGLSLAGAWFALAALSADPEPRLALPPARRLLAAGLAASALVAAALVANPTLMPPAPLVQAAAGLAASGFVYAAFSNLRAWRLLRLPSLGLLSLATIALAFGIVSVASAGAIEQAVAWKIEAAVVASAALPAIALLLEQRSRPGLRSLVLGLALPSAAIEMGRGNPAPMHRLLDAVQDYDDSLRGHVSRVAALSVRMGMRMRLNASHLREIALAAQLHDVGKIVIPRSILCKPMSLTPAEFEIMKRHTIAGERIVRRVPDLVMAMRGVGEHHERWDGAGYPYAREGAGISLTARIVAVADVYDALVSRRAYKEGWSKDEAIAEIIRGAGSHFDPRVVDELLHVVGETDRVVQPVAA